MDKLDFDQRIKANAYRLFHAEFHKHLEMVKGRFAAPGNPSLEELKQLGGIFHMVRGGAGFFGLDGVALLSQKLEQLLLHDAAQVSNRLAEAKKLVEELERLARSIPPPTQSS